MNKYLVVFIALILCSFTLTRKALPSEKLTNTLYETTFNSNEKPAFKPFELGVAGYYHLKAKGKIQNEILTIADFSVSANAERLWVIDMKNSKVLFHTLVAHGRNTGDEFAKNFSNESGSYQSSLGFYLTDHLYEGKHGLSLRLDGLEKGFNDKARQRAIVIHAADYVSKDFVKSNGRLGRSLGCPALPNDLNESIVNTIKGKSCLFIYYPDNEYLNASELLSDVNA